MTLFPYFLLAAALVALVLICATAVAVADKRKHSASGLEQTEDHLEKLTDYASDTFVMLEQIAGHLTRIGDTLDRIDTRAAEEAEGELDEARASIAKWAGQ